VNRRSALALLLLLAAHAAGAQQVNVEARREGDAVLVEAHARLKADPRLAWDVLTDYGRYAQFVPDLTSSSILARAGNTVIVEQKGVAGFFLFRFPLEVRLEVTERPYGEVGARAIAGNFKEMTGVYRLVPDGEALRFVYSGRLVPAFGLPPLIGTAAVRIAVERQFTALVREILRREKDKAS
jgi:ribosome-associated toxin RatA of RatAB toxin-antitoxin module